MSSAPHSPRHVAAVTGSRAEYGLLRPVLHAIQRRNDLHLSVIAAGSHLLEPRTDHEIRAEFSVAATVPMQTAAARDRLSDAAALGRGICGFADVLRLLSPDVVLVLGDRIEALAAATAASVGGIRVAHMHGGDRAEGIADDGMRHAITKLCHLHLPATQQSALRLIAMGEDPKRVHIVGSPAIDGLAEIPAISDAEFSNLGSPEIVVLLHPVGDSDAIEYERAKQLFEITARLAPALALHPNHDPGRDGIIQAIEDCKVQSVSHLPRTAFIGLLRRVKAVVGNSSAGLIECAALPIQTINIGSRQSGREMPSNVVNVPDWNYQTITDRLIWVLQQNPLTPRQVAHPYGDGQSGKRSAHILAAFSFDDHPIRKINSY